MDTTRPGARRRVPFEARPGRSAVVASNLSELRGPTHGVVELPHRLFWQPDRHLDLDGPGMLGWMYEMVLTDAVTVEELRTWLHGPTLQRLWPDIFVPQGVREAWELRHPGLRARAAA